ncbi:hypothetical protein M0657_012246 [Pyricularia oryzae]|uniref:Uncharacterized protein n=2 Tax=Pyricularia oryzae TaxID=318829 RepID=A0A4P7NMH8_PYROR|nr:hypothetical protein MCOR19_002222 [Pyricularia oryzae]KAI6284011.1 hypothetical protein MCOR26_002138 [Pyricularia oryzae]KAI6342390.1 hypothetical protein MCOR28_005470 [Pyricularia oryzae]KAI6488772.1 hypothetical protein MCOR18_002779 [Pyricularia oryzae]KAI7908449.1 hypothetical protein M9X92_012181 [Pyricularia oryzae]
MLYRYILLALSMSFGAFAKPTEKTPFAIEARDDNPNPCFKTKKACCGGIHGLENCSAVCASEGKLFTTCDPDKNCSCR